MLSSSSSSSSFQAMAAAVVVQALGSFPVFLFLQLAPPWWSMDGLAVSHLAWFGFWWLG